MQRRGPQPTDRARRALFFLRPNLGIEVGGGRVAAEDNLRPKENTDAKISHGNLGPSRFELVRRLDKYKLRAPPRRKSGETICRVCVDPPPADPHGGYGAKSSAQLANHRFHASTSSLDRGRLPLARAVSVRFHSTTECICASRSDQLLLECGWKSGQEERGPQN